MRLLNAALCECVDIEIVILRKVIHSFSRSFSSDSSSGEIRQNEKDRSVTRLYRGILDSDWSMGRPMKREETNVKFLSCIRILFAYTN